MCKVCNNKEALNMSYTPFRLKVREGEIYIEKYYGDMEEWVEKDDMLTKIKYCPMCGYKV